jgi:transcriptional regulator with GAF, ATPase, and Fis domain
MRARLCLIDGEAKPDVVELNPERPISLGRSRDNTIVIPRDEHASRLHAKIFFESGGWRVQDFGLNGTRVDNERIDQVSDLMHGSEVRIGDVRFRFTLPDQQAHASQHKFIAADRLESGHTIPISSTKLHLDALSTLCQFMAAAIEARDPNQLVQQGLQTLLHQTGASLVGYFSLDPTNPAPKMVLPEAARIDQQLCRLLTRRVQREGKLVWLGADSLTTRLAPDGPTAISDALCVPLRAVNESLGALHVYRSAARFTERDARFCEALAGHVAHGLHVLKERRKLEAENARLRARLSAADDLLGDSPAMVNLRERIGRAAAQPLDVLIQGDCGTGKELIALAVHRRSGRSQGPFVAVNCVAIAPAIMEAELFGCRRGAFSGAERDHSGLLLQADEGTLFFDEIADLTPDCQAKLASAIEVRSFRPVGAAADAAFDVRIIAATRHDLDREAKAGHFNQQLLSHLSAVSIPAPSLRDRPEDVPYLVQYFLDKLAIECRRSVHLAPSAIEFLQRSPLPGNVRQLRALLECASMATDTDTIDADQLRRMLASIAELRPTPIASGDPTET